LGSLVNGRPKRVGYAGLNAENIRHLVAAENTSVGLGFDGMPIRTGVVRVLWRGDRLVPKDAIKDTDLPIDAIADRGAQGNVGLPNREVRASPAENRLSTEH